MSLKRKLNNDKFHYLYSTPNIIRLQLTYVLPSAITNITNWEEYVGLMKEKIVHNFGTKPRRKETTRKSHNRSMRTVEVHELVARN
jgi:hypothetical protein